MSLFELEHCTVSISLPLVHKPEVLCFIFEPFSFSIFEYFPLVIELFSYHGFLLCFDFFVISGATSSRVFCN